MSPTSTGTPLYIIFARYVARGFPRIVLKFLQKFQFSDQAGRLIELMVGKGALVNFQNSFGETPLHRYGGNNEQTQNNATCKQINTPLTIPPRATMNGQAGLEMCKHLTKHGADICVANRNGNSCCCCLFCFYCVDFIIVVFGQIFHRSLYVNLLTCEGETPLHYASRMQREGVVLFLMKLGADPHSVVT
jgi:ankyrin repeat protein